MPAVSGRGFDGDVLLVQCNQTRTPVTLEEVDAKVVLRDLASAPVADLPVEELVSVYLDNPPGHDRPAARRPRRPRRVRAVRLGPLRLITVAELLLQLRAANCVCLRVTTSPDSPGSGE